MLASFLSLLQKAMLMSVNANARAMPDRDTVIGWQLRGLGGIVNMLEMLAENDVILNRDQSRELFALTERFHFCASLLLASGDNPELPNS